MAPSRRLLTALTALSPLALLLVLELTLRGVGFGDGHPLFVPAEGMPGYRQASPELIRRYLRGARGLAAEAIPFREEKPPGGYRIVVQGGSTAAGFPGEYARARRYLERSLRLEPGSPATLQALVRVDLKLGDRARAGLHLAQLREIAPSHPLVRRLESRREARAPPRESASGGVR